MCCQKNCDANTKIVEDMNCRKKANDDEVRRIDIVRLLVQKMKQPKRNAVQYISEFLISVSFYWVRVAIKVYTVVEIKDELLINLMLVSSKISHARLVM